MKKIREAWTRFKAKHWDDDFDVENLSGMPWFKVERKPARFFWEKHKVHIIKGSKWLTALIAGALIIRWIGLG